MTSDRTGWATESARFGARQFLAENPPRVLVTAVVPRPVLQCLFLTVLAGVLGGVAQRDYAVVGAPAAAAMLVAVLISELPLADKTAGTFGWLRTGRPHPFLVTVLRALPYPVLGVVALAASLAIVPPLTGYATLVPRLVPLVPLYALTITGACAAGLAVALLVLGRRADVLASNLLSYLFLLTGGVFVPPDRVPFAEAVGTVLPVRHGLDAVRAALAGRPWLGAAVAEVAVAAGWLVLAAFVLRVQIARAHRHGHDDHL